MRDSRYYSDLAKKIPKPLLTQEDITKDVQAFLAKGNLPELIPMGMTSAKYRLNQLNRQQRKLHATNTAPK